MRSDPKRCMGCGRLTIERSIRPDGTVIVECRPCWLVWRDSQ